MVFLAMAFLGLATASPADQTKACARFHAVCDLTLDQIDTDQAIRDESLTAADCAAASRGADKTCGAALWWYHEHRRSLGPRDRTISEDQCRGWIAACKDLGK